MIRGLLAVVYLFAATSGAWTQSVTAVLEPAQLVDLKAVTAGRLTDIAVEEGDVVKKGAKLAQLATDEQSQRVELAKVIVASVGPIKRAKAQLAQAQSILVRLERARERGAAQAWEVEQAQQAVSLAEAEVQISQDDSARAAAQLQVELAVLNKFQLLAPFDGIILRRQVDVGASLDPQTVVLTVGRVTSLKATAFVPVEWLSELTLGQSIDVDIDGLSQTRVPVIVTFIDPRIDPASRTIRITLRLENSDGRVLPGSTLTLAKP